MNIDLKKKIAINLLQQRNFAYVIVAFLMIVTTALLVRIWSVNERIIIVPSLSDPDKRYQVDGDHLDDSYFQDWAASLLGDLYTANPKTVLQKTKTFLQWALSSSSLSSDLEKSAKALKKDQISTAFYPETFKISRKSKEIYVTGMFLTFFGRSMKPITSQKTFALGWQILSGGTVSIRSLKELKNDKN